MANIIEGYISGKGLKFGIVAARFNEFIVSKLVSGALDTLHRHETADADIDIAWVPGAFEIPLAAKRMAESGKYDAILCLGAVIRGETDHYAYVSTEVTKGIAQVSLSTGVPILYGVLTTDTVEQALNRAGLKAGNKGFECALDALELVSLYKKIGR